MTGFPWTWKALRDWFLEPVMKRLDAIETDIQVIRGRDKPDV